jgi:hypothetical protein
VGGGTVKSLGFSYVNGLVTAHCGVTNFWIVKMPNPRVVTFGCHREGSLRSNGELTGS